THQAYKDTPPVQVPSAVSHTPPAPPAQAAPSAPPASPAQTVPPAQTAPAISHEPVENKISRSEIERATPSLYEEKL
ncbi:MAG: hypothetical protein OXT03_02040, partial [Alphaproteobacteria bacterium]|nr:hypothetical protein [Alphaproteobacteria bacterium]